MVINEKGNVTLPYVSERDIIGLTYPEALSMILSNAPYVYQCESTGFMCSMSEFLELRFKSARLRMKKTMR